MFVGLIITNCIICGSVRGEKRRILEVVINADLEITYETFPISLSNDLTREQIIEGMLKGGVWPRLMQPVNSLISLDSMSNI